MKAKKVKFIDGKMISIASLYFNRNYYHLYVITDQESETSQLCVACCLYQFLVADIPTTEMMRAVLNSKIFR